MSSSRVNPPSAAARGLMYLNRESWTMAMPSVARSTSWRYFSSLSRRASSARRRAVVSLRMTSVRPSPPAGPTRWPRRTGSRLAVDHPVLVKGPLGARDEGPVLGVDEVEEIESPGADLLGRPPDQGLERRVGVLDPPEGNDVDTVGGIGDEGAEHLIAPFPKHLEGHLLSLIICGTFGVNQDFAYQSFGRSAPLKIEKFLLIRASLFPMMVLDEHTRDGFGG